MNYQTIRDGLVTQLAAVSGIGIVSPQRRLSADWTTFLNKFLVNHPTISGQKVINFTYVTRVSGRETETEDEAEERTAVEVAERWQIVLTYGFDDDDNPAIASETAFSNLSDNIQARFRFLDRLGIPGTIHSCSPASLVSADVRKFGEVLCHVATFELDITQRVVS